MLDAGADANRRDASGKTALHQAVARNRRLVELVLAARPDLSLTSREGETALAYARRLEKTAVVALIEAACA